jgi:hypothetical protein
VRKVVITKALILKRARCGSIFGVRKRQRVPMQITDISSASDSPTKSIDVKINGWATDISSRTPRWTTWGDMIAPRIASVRNSTLNCRDPVLKDRIRRVLARAYVARM